MGKAFFHFVLIALFVAKNCTGQGVLSCYSGVAVDVVETKSIPDNIETETECLTCMRTKIEGTTGQADTRYSQGVQAGLSLAAGIGFTIWSCQKTMSTVLGIPQFPSALQEVATFLDTLHNNATCLDSLCEFRPKTAGRLTLCTCCTDMCNGNTTACPTSPVYTQSEAAAVLLQMASTPSYSTSKIGSANFFATAISIGPNVIVIWLTALGLLCKLI